MSYAVQSLTGLGTERLLGSVLSGHLAFPHVDKKCLWAGCMLPDVSISGRVSWTLTVTVTMLKSEWGGTKGQHSCSGPSHACLPV